MRRQYKIYFIDRYALGAGKAYSSYYYTFRARQGQEVVRAILSTFDAPWPLVSVQYKNFTRKLRIRFFGSFVLSPKNGKKSNTILRLIKQASYHETIDCKDLLSDIFSKCL